VISYLRTKQLEIPQLFHIAPYDLPAVYGSASHPCLVNRHIYKVFDNIKSLIMDEADLGDWVVGGVNSFSGESLTFSEPWPFIGSPGLFNLSTDVSLT
jgi:hypothetical protein